MDEPPKWYYCPTDRGDVWYWFHSGTKESSWSPPANLSSEEQRAARIEGHANYPQHAVFDPWQPPAEARTPSSSIAERPASVSTWTSPVAVAPPRPPRRMGDLGSSATPSTAATASSAEDWDLRASRKTGRRYWFNVRTGQTSWTIPEALRQGFAALVAEAALPVVAPPPVPRTASPLRSLRDAPARTAATSVDSEALGNDHKQDCKLEAARHGLADELERRELHWRRQLEATEAALAASRREAAELRSQVERLRRRLAEAGLSDIDAVL